MKNAAMAQVVEHILGKDEVGSSSLPSSSKEKALALQVLFLLLGARRTDLKIYHTVGTGLAPVRKKLHIHHIDGQPQGLSLRILSNLIIKKRSHTRTL
jgi:hypothetical protein